MANGSGRKRNYGIYCTIGLNWNPSSDMYFSIQNYAESFKSKKKKISILSEISTLFDSNGWLAQAIIKTKILIQSLLIVFKIIR